MESSRGSRSGVRGGWRAAFCLLCALLALGAGHPSVFREAWTFARAAQAADQGAPQPDRHVLVLYSSVFLPAYREFSATLYAAFARAGVSSANIHCEFLELSRIVAPAEREAQRAWIAEKYKGLDVGALITLDGPAQDFVLRDAGGLLPGVPLVSVLAPVVLQAPVPGRTVLQIPSRGNFAGTLEVALRLFPGTRRVLFVVGAADVERQWRAMAEQAFAPWSGSLSIEYTSDLAREEMMRRVAALPADAVVFYMSYYRDAAGAPAVPLDVAREIARVSPAPVVGLYDTLMGTGVLGGSMNSYGAEGGRAAELALGLMSGRDAPEGGLAVIPCVNRPTFDWAQLQRWKVSIGDLPPDSDVRGRPPTLWEQYREVVTGAVLVFLLLVLLIAALLVQNRRRREAETAARLSEERYRVLVQHAPEAILVTDAQTRLTVDANAKALALFGGGGLGELLGRRALDCLPEQPGGVTLEESLREAGVRALAGEEVVIDALVRNARGEERTCEVRMIRLPSEGRTLLRTSWIDITERKRLQDQLRRSESDLKAILDNMPSMISSWDKNLRNRFANQAYVRWLGLDARGLAGMHLREVIGEERFLRNQPQIEGVMAGQPQLFERAIPTPDGRSVRHSLAHYIPDTANGEVQGFYALITDITSVKQAEQAVLASLREKEVLLREIHHRVKNNLQIISSLLSLQGQGVASAEARRIIEESQGRILSMALIHEQLYRSQDLARIDMAGYLSKLLPVVRAAFTGPCAVTVRVEATPFTLALDQAIPFGLIVNELATNAFKHAFTGRQAGTVEVLASARDGLVTLTIADDGVGLPPGLSVDNLASLGLQIVSMLTDQLHGTLQAASDGGTRFVLEFPLHAP